MFSPNDKKEPATATALKAGETAAKEGETAQNTPAEGAPARPWYVKLYRDHELGINIALCIGLFVGLAFGSNHLSQRYFTS